MASLLPNGRQQFVDQNGRPLIGGSVAYYEPGTETKKDTWQDEAMSMPNTNPVILDARGQATIWGEGTYRQVVHDRNGVLIWDQEVTEYTADFTEQMTAFVVGLAASDGSTKIGFLQAGAGAAQRTVQDKSRERVSVDDYFEVGDLDFTNAFERAGVYLATRGGGIIVCPQSSYTASKITIRRYQIFEGLAGSCVEFKQAAGANQDFITSENFTVLTGTGLDVAGDARVPSWFGLRRVRVNGNGAAQTSGRGVALYGSFILLEDVVVTNAFGDGLHTEYATTVTGTSDWTTQEEGVIRNLVCRNNGGVGWRNRGPHNVHMDNIICCFNVDYGYVSEILAGKYNGAPTYCTSLHGYSNDTNWDASQNRARKNMSIGTNMSCGLLVVDGGQCVISSSNSLIAILKQYLGGQGNADAVIISGDINEIGVYNGIMRNDGVSTGVASGAACLRVTGNYNKVGVAHLVGTANLFNGLIITGTGNDFPDVTMRDCLTSLKITGSRNRVNGKSIFATTGFSYVTPTDGSPGHNDVELDIFQNGAGYYVTGDSPVSGSDRFLLTAYGIGSTVKYTRRRFEKTALASDVTAVQTVTVAHNLLYAPPRAGIQLTMSGMTDPGARMSMLRVSAVDDTNITIVYQFSTAGAAGSTFSCCIDAEVF